MPTYSYACTQCDNRFDIVQSFSDASLTVCGQCQGRLRKVFDSVGVVFKGSGFYRTDARGSNGSGSKSPSTTSSETSGGSSSSGASSSSNSAAPSSTSSTAAASAAAS
ncbi:regulatory protein, FmdB family [Segniliparus rotundus DSM 44985]|uniref:Regulatory protein, FmdB family n=1 Tax=Segniliparus rotundus (strain ATCC BAA-972 / CDC 1076 / CIP 108378 / DSM 44985 / JCM 13578) TaxID=640132 RepID=D6ZFL6_SEGRD|nr:FmdB family zinc ribbon protein [Segniliparus rotundus]ADG97740.1 regulatory protein, FmdB family [Segniliparus rotundus DSM 44985]